MTVWPFRTGDLATMPPFTLPFPRGAKVVIQTYVGHNPDNMKMDMYAYGPDGSAWPNDSAVLAAADGYVHEWFDPGGLEINHGNGWFTVYLHMDRRVPVGTTVKQGQWVGRADTVGTWAKHLHHEHEYRTPPTSDVDTTDMVNPSFYARTERGGPVTLVRPLELVPNHAVTLYSTANTRPQPKPPNWHPTGRSPHHGMKWPGLPAGHYYGPINGPAESHGGFHERDRAAVKALQEQLVWLGCAYGVRYPAPRWCDGKFEAATSKAVQQAHAKTRIGDPHSVRVGKPLWDALMSK